MLTRLMSDELALRLSIAPSAKVSEQHSNSTRLLRLDPEPSPFSPLGSPPGLHPQHGTGHDQHRCDERKGPAPAHALDHLNYDSCPASP